MTHHDDGWKLSAYVVLAVAAGLLIALMTALYELRVERDRVNMLTALMDMQCSSYVVGQVAAIMIVGDKLTCVRGVYTPSRSTLLQYMNSQTTKSKTAMR